MVGKTSKRRPTDEKKYREGYDSIFSDKLNIIRRINAFNDYFKCNALCTCCNCSEKMTCKYSYDFYNTNGDCLASK